MSAGSIAARGWQEVLGNFPAAGDGGHAAAGASHTAALREKVTCHGGGGGRSAAQAERGGLEARGMEIQCGWEII